LSVYVDRAINQYGRMMMCHMTADTLDELHAMADAIGIRRKWFQADASLPHYDICKSKRALAIANGAREIDWRELAAMIKRYRVSAEPVTKK